MASTDGFVRLPNWLIDDSDLSLHELAVYMVLLRFRDHKTGKCHPGMTTIADRARISKRAVIRAIEGLERREMIQVHRRSTITDNKPNVYTVAVATEEPKFVWSQSARGRRIPKRSPSDSLSPGQEEEAQPSDSQSLPSDSQSPNPVTPSHPNKIHKNKNHEQALRRTLQSTPEDLFSFDEIPKATEKQLNYLNDLYIFITEHIPQQRTRDKWEALDLREASDLIDAYWRQMDRGRGGMWNSNVDETHSAFRALSPLGRRWIANGHLPETLEAA